MKKFQQNVSRELRRAYPDRRRLECQCLSAISFVKNEPDMLDSPIWVLIINVVAMDMLKSKLPPSKCGFHQIRHAWAHDLFVLFIILQYASQVDTSLLTNFSINWKLRFLSSNNWKNDLSACVILYQNYYVSWFGCDIGRSVTRMIIMWF